MSLDAYKHMHMRSECIKMYIPHEQKVREREREWAVTKTHRHLFSQRLQCLENKTSNCHFITVLPDKFLYLSSIRTVVLHKLCCSEHVVKYDSWQACPIECTLEGGRRWMKKSKKCTKWGGGIKCQVMQKIWVQSNGNKNFIARRVNVWELSDNNNNRGTNVPNPE